ncbi:hypothetical protein LCGC14_2887020 [marine sediment metagenome]|uniref:Uncharacterized protein n=1 Tax=marine sediment metagenome TaxID=412755 RepID=A0A0F8XYD9_9ZZZZ
MPYNHKLTKEEHLANGMSEKEYEIQEALGSLPVKILAMGVELDLTEEELAQHDPVKMQAAMKKWKEKAEAMGYKFPKEDK